MEYTDWEFRSLYEGPVTRISNDVEAVRASGHYPMYGGGMWKLTEGDIEHLENGGLLIWDDGEYFTILAYERSE